MLVGWFSLFSAATATTKKLLKMLVRLRYQCKEMFKVPVKDHWENDASEDKKADLTNVIVTHKSSPCLENYVCILILKKVQSMS